MNKNNPWVIDLDIDFNNAFEAFKTHKEVKTLEEIDLDKEDSKEFKELYDIVLSEVSCINCGHEINDGDFGKCYELMENDNIVKACDCRRHYNVNK
jgi:hypothetical protein